MENNREKYFSQLNGIRFIAVFLVLLDHWLVPILPVPLGQLGVVIFFVLSGFLITRILFISSDEIKLNNTQALPKILRFIFRRSLRIFPIYFILLGIGLLFNLSNFRSLWPWLVFYLPNFYIMLHSNWLGVWDHLWSLAVEEQYYLFFPYFIFSISQKKFKYLFPSMIVIGIMSRIIFYTTHTHTLLESNWMSNYVNPISTLDSFGLGGLLAYLFHYHYSVFTKISQIQGSVFISLSCVLISLYFSKVSNFVYDNIWFTVLEKTFDGIFAFFLIMETITQKKHILGKFLEHATITYLGLISYGIYLYHNLIYNHFHTKSTLWSILENNIEAFQSDLANFVLIRFAFNFMILIGLASLSWFFIEKPINRFKNRF